MPRSSVKWAIAGVLLTIASEARAGGFGSPEISVRGVGRANSGEAADTGVDSLWWNPAAIARSGREVSVGLSASDFSTSFVDEGSSVTRPIPPAGLTTPTGGTAKVSDGGDTFVAPTFAAAMPIGERFAVGFSVAHPFQLQTAFGTTAWTRYDTIRSQISITDLQLTGAVRATDWLDLGLGVDAQYDDAYLDQAFPNLAPTAPDAVSQLAGDGWSYGWTVGAQAHLRNLTLGASYRSKVDQKLAGRLSVSGLQAPLDGANFSAPATTRFATPWTLTVAARWQATPRLTLNGQVVRSGWAEYDVIRVDFAGQQAAIAQDFKDTTSIALGADYVLNPVWTVRAGVQFDPTPTPDDLREPGIFDSDRTLFAVGASTKLSSSITLESALLYTRFARARLFDDDVFYEGTPAQTVARSRGTFSGHGATASLGLNWRF